MTEKRFKFRRFDVDVENINKIALYEIDNNPSDDLDESNLFYVYSTTDANIQDIIDKLNNQDKRIRELEKENKLKGDFRNFINEDIVQIKKENAQLKKQLKDYDFRFEYTKDFERIDANTLKVDDTYTKIDCDGKKIKIMLNPPNTKPCIFEYYITGVIFNKKVM